MRTVLSGNFSPLKHRRRAARTLTVNPGFDGEKSQPRWARQLCAKCGHGDDLLRDLVATIVMAEATAMTTHIININAMMGKKAMATSAPCAAFSGVIDGSIRTKRPIISPQQMTEVMTKRRFIARRVTFGPLILSPNAVVTRPQYHGTVSIAGPLRADYGLAHALLHRIIPR